MFFTDIANMSQLEIITRIFNWTILAAFVVCFVYMARYFFSKFRKWEPAPPALKQHRFAILIAARNEAEVLGFLIDSIHAQNYDQANIDIYVVADNCTDHTAAVARNHGAICYERFNDVKKGKSYVLEYIICKLRESGDFPNYDGFMIFDADNILDSNFISEINNTFSMGYDVVTGYRNSKNLTDNWISYGYGLWFMHEAGFRNRGRMLEGSSCMVAGTGYVVSRKVLEDFGGWNWHLLTEDIEFTAECIYHDIKIGYNESAVFYDEQPVSLSVSFTQRLRWVKGYLQVFHRYGKRLLTKAFCEHSLSAYDMQMSYVPAFFITIYAFFVHIALLLIGLFNSMDMSFTIYSCFMLPSRTYLTLLAFGIYTYICEHEHMPDIGIRHLGYLLMFPIYMFTYFPIAILALFKKVDWKPIRHGNSTNHSQSNIQEAFNKTA
ncbi:glycosyltransferase family 2 protein [Eubacterium oxidoreducens]|uniref:Glycosyltransferase, catalytic subunit of cellulose synthase and poly-beta-1,6-N-acetylglucosamine synthase n=1 Tax=Eubacterium oxidoreducens TaxID=1732 RepID=A0A1G6CEF8_EUBOX|nr:glycosyltransferase family 2 protein [Eubacterium oxidoreducens]SDB31257.1 Glycosyltransferase, catalytic subunit of cellulose synthase and poly-beta-1,6-N-acetylglucosamine synthase [Eubacterium oxidoreducens]